MSEAWNWHALLLRLLTAIHRGAALARRGKTVDGGWLKIPRLFFANGKPYLLATGLPYVLFFLMPVKKDGACVKAVRFAAFCHPKCGGVSIADSAMNRKQLEHIVRASGSISGCRELVVIGSQAILGAWPDAPKELLTSMEADLYPAEAPGKAELIDGCIGELSPFHDTFGYYAHGVGPETATLPSGWKRRLIRVENENTGGSVALCLAPVDLAISKLLAGRPKDIEFVATMMRMKVVAEPSIRQAIQELEPADIIRADQLLGSCLK